jgi:thymidylate synthase
VRDLTTYASVQDAYLAELQRTFDDFHYRNAPRGHDSVERVGVAFEVEDPVQRHITVPARRANIVFCLAEALWYLSGSDSLPAISYYAPSMAKYSADGVTLQGTAYGPRIFDLGRSGLDQWRSVVDTLRSDPDSKRAVIQIFEGRELRVAENIDVACTLALQFMLRDGRLCLVAYMRANDAFRGAVSDLFSFTFLQEVMARQLGVAVGTYTHLVGSYHVYLDDAAWARNVLDGRDPQAPHRAFPTMPEGDVWEWLATVLDLERLLRLDRLRLTADAISGLPLPRYWRDVVALFELHRHLRHGVGPADECILALLDPCHRLMLGTRWPELVDSYAVPVPAR